MAEVAGLTSFSFGDDEDSRYVMVFKKVGRGGASIKWGGVPWGERGGFGGPPTPQLRALPHRSLPPRMRSWRPIGVGRSGTQ